MTLVEVMFAAVILTMVVFGVLQAMLQSRRMTEGSIRQATVASLVQGYMEQIKSLKYATTGNALPDSPSATPSPADTSAAGWGAFSLPVKNSYQANDFIYLAVGPAPTTLAAINSLPTSGLSFHTESVDIDNTISTADNCTLNMWVWITPLTGTNVVNCKSIVIAYQWTVKDGARVRTYNDMMRIVRSIVPTDG